MQMLPYAVESTPLTGAVVFYWLAAANTDIEFTFTVPSADEAIVCELGTPVTISMTGEESWEGKKITFTTDEFEGAGAYKITVGDAEGSEGQKTRALVSDDGGNLFYISGLTEEYSAYFALEADATITIICSLEIDSSTNAPYSSGVYTVTITKLPDPIVGENTLFANSAGVEFFFTPEETATYEFTWTDNTVQLQFNYSAEWITDSPFTLECTAGNWVTIVCKVGEYNPSQAFTLTITKKTETTGDNSDTTGDNGGNSEPTPPESAQ